MWDDYLEESTNVVKATLKEIKCYHLVLSADLGDAMIAFCF